MAQAVATLWRREIIRFYRQRGRLVGALGTPLVFWILIGSGVGESFRPAAAPDDLHYLVYFYPGTILLMLLFTAIFSTISLIEDRREGFLLSVLVSPVSRAGVVLGKILGGATLAFLQGLVFLLLAPLAGIYLGLGQILLMMCVMALIALSLTGLGFVIAWQSESIQGFHAVMNLMLIPMWILSGALFPFSGASTWIQLLMRINPLSYEVSLLRHALHSEVPALGIRLPSFTASLAVTLLFVLVVFGISLWLVRRPGLRGLS
jgi:ABC-2 type transport system permease protein